MESSPVQIPNNPDTRKNPRQEPQFSISVTGFDGERAVTLSGYGHGYDFGYDFATVLVHAQNTLPRRTGSPQFVPHRPVGHSRTPATTTPPAAPLFAAPTLPDLRRRRMHRCYILIRGFAVAPGTHKAPRHKRTAPLSSSPSEWRRVRVPSASRHALCYISDEDTEAPCSSLVPDLERSRRRLTRAVNPVQAARRVSWQAY
jgi:hypothetical protein